MQLSAASVALTQGHTEDSLGTFFQYPGTHLPPLTYQITAPSGGMGFLWKPKDNISNSLP